MGFSGREMTSNDNFSNTSECIMFKKSHEYETPSFLFANSSLRIEVREMKTQ